MTWLNGLIPVQTGGGVSMGRHVTVNRLEIQHIKRDALNNTYVCQASNTKLVPPAERSVRVEMLCKCAKVDSSYYNSLYSFLLSFDPNIKTRNYANYFIYFFVALFHSETNINKFGS